MCELHLAAYNAISFLFRSDKRSLKDITCFTVPMPYEIVDPRHREPSCAGWLLEGVFSSRILTVGNSPPSSRDLRIFRFSVKSVFTSRRRASRQSTLHFGTMTSRFFTSVRVIYENQYSFKLLIFVSPLSLDKVISKRRLPKRSGRPLRRSDNSRIINRDLDNDTTRQLRFSFEQINENEISFSSFL